MDYHSNSLYDCYVRPINKVKDYRTSYSGITKQHLDQASKTLGDVQQDLLSLIHPTTILVGHSLENDLRVLKLKHDRIIDTAVLYERNGRKIKLKQLAYELLDKVLLVVR